MIVTKHNPLSRAPQGDAMTLDVVREFHRRMAAIVEAVQTGAWERGLHDMVGYATDYAFGQERGVQTLVLKTKQRSTYVRLQWDTVMGDGVAEVHAVETAINKAIGELS